MRQLDGGDDGIPDSSNGEVSQSEFTDDARFSPEHPDTPRKYDGEMMWCLHCERCSPSMAGSGRSSPVGKPSICVRTKDAMGTHPQARGLGQNWSRQTITRRTQRLVRGIRCLLDRCTGKNGNSERNLRRLLSRSQVASSSNRSVSKVRSPPMIGMYYFRVLPCTTGASP